MVRFENVGLRYSLGPEVLRDVSFALEPNSFQFLTGPSGAGKSSLLRLLFLALRPTRGSGIPQVIAALETPDAGFRERNLSLRVSCAGQATPENSRYISTGRPSKFRKD